MPRRNRHALPSKYRMRVLFRAGEEPMQTSIVLGIIVESRGLQERVAASDERNA